jgi:hypothetical protein
MIDSRDGEGFGDGEDSYPRSVASENAVEYRMIWSNVGSDDDLSPGELDQPDALHLLQIFAEQHGSLKPGAGA